MNGAKTVFGRACAAKAVVLSLLCVLAAVALTGVALSAARAEDAGYDTLYRVNFNDMTGWECEYTTTGFLNYTIRVDGGNPQPTKIVGVNDSNYPAVVTPRTDVSVDRYSDVRVVFELWKIPSDFAVTGAKLYFSTDNKASWDETPLTCVNTERTAVLVEEAGYEGPLYSFTTENLSACLAGKTITHFKIAPFEYHRGASAIRLADFKILTKAKTAGMPESYTDDLFKANINNMSGWTTNCGDGSFLKLAMRVDGVQVRNSAVAGCGGIMPYFATPQIKVSTDKYADVKVYFELWRQANDAVYADLPITDAKLYYSSDYGDTWNLLPVTCTDTGKVAVYTEDPNYYGPIYAYTTENLNEVLPDTVITNLKFEPFAEVPAQAAVRMLDFKVTTVNPAHVTPEDPNEYGGNLFAVNFFDMSGWDHNTTTGFLSSYISIDGKPAQISSVNGCNGGRDRHYIATPQMKVTVNKYSEITVKFELWQQTNSAQDPDPAITAAKLYYSTDFAETWTEVPVTCTDTGKTVVSAEDDTYSGPLYAYATDDLCKTLGGKVITHFKIEPFENIPDPAGIRLVAFKVAAIDDERITPEVIDTVPNDTLYIQQLINTAKANGETEVTIPHTNPRDGSNTYRIATTIKLPSDMTVYIDDCTLRLARGVFCNMFTNETAWNDKLTAAEEQKNIKLIGLGDNATLDGGVHNGLTEFTCGRNGYPDYIALNAMVIFRNVDGLEVSNLTIVEQRWWSFLNIYVSNAVYKDIRFKATNYVPNQDGIDLRIGCNNFDISNITGDTGDDVIALTALFSFTDMLFKVEGKNSDIHDVNIHNINARSVAGFFIVRLLMQDGNQIYNIDIDGIHDRHIDTGTRAGAVVYAGEIRFFTYKQAQFGDMHDVTVKNVTTNCHNAAILVANPVITKGDITYSNVVNTVNGRAIDYPGPLPVRPTSEKLYNKEFNNKDDAAGWVSNIGDAWFLSGEVDGVPTGYITYVEYDQIIQFISPEMIATADKYSDLRLEFHMWVNEGNGPDPDVNGVLVYYSADFGNSWSAEPLTLNIVNTQKRMVCSDGSSGYIYKLSTENLAELLQGEVITRFRINPYQRLLVTGSPKLIDFKLIGSLKEGEAVATPIDLSKALTWSTTNSNVRYSGAAALDGRADTCWQAANSMLPQKLLVDLERVERIEKINTIFGSESAWQYRIYHSLDGEVWKNYVDRTDNQTVGAEFTDLNAVTARYIAIEITGGGLVSVAELEIINDLAVNAAINKPCAVTSTAENGGTAAAAFDGILGTRYCASDNRMPQQLGVDFGSSIAIGGVRVSFEQQSLYRFVAETSIDGIVWTQYGIGNEQGQVFDLTGERTARYLRITVNGSSDGAWASIWEVEVFADSAPRSMIDNIVLAQPHGVTVAENIANGSVAADVTSAYRGDTVTLNITAEDGYELSWVKVNGYNIVADADGVYAFAMPDGDAVITAEFTETVIEIEEFEVVVSNDIENGAVSADKTVAAAGETVTLNIVPAEGYKLSWVKVNGNAITADADGVYVFAMPDGDAEVTAAFEPVGGKPDDKPGNIGDNADNGGSKDNTALVLGITIPIAALAVILAVVAVLIVRKKKNSVK